MDIGKIFPIVIVTLIVVSCNNPNAEKNKKQSVSSDSSTAPESQQEKGTATQEQVLPDTEEPGPAPELSQEERERLIRGTEIEKSSPKENSYHSKE